MRKKGNLYWPTKEFQKKAVQSNKKIYQQAAKDPVKFWENLASQLFWYKKWSKGFVHKPPYFEWFSGGKINITANIFEKNLTNIAAARKLQKKTALIWEPEPTDEEPKIFTYQQLFQEVNKFANALKKLGVRKGDRVGIYLPMIPEVVIAMLACARIGAVHTVVFSAFSPSALKIRLQDTGAKILITADGYWRRGKVINLKQNADEGVKGTKVKKVVVVKRVGRPAGNKIHWRKTRDLWWHELIKGQSDQCQPRVMDSEDLLFLLATSGSTGRPKQVMHTCGGYTVQAYWTWKWIFDLQGNDVFWCTSDPGWITGHTYTIYAPLLNGETTLMYEGAPDWPKPDRWAKIIEKHKVSIFYTAPTAIRMFEKQGTELVKKYKFKTLRLLGSVGEPIDEAAWLWYYRNVGKEKCPIVDTWWQTETGGILITSLPGIGPFKPGFTGLPFPGIKIDILDDKARPCPKDRQGNLVVLPPFAPSLLRGVYKNPKKYLETYWSQHGKKVYFTSDAAYRDKNGLIRIVGRVDDVIKVAGHRLTTGELEEAINRHPDITECAVIGIPDKIKGEAPIAFAVLKGKSAARGGTENTSPLEMCSPKVKNEVIGQISKQIGPIAKPKEVYIVEALPKTRSGKIMRRILRKLFTGEPLGDLSTLANPGTVEKIKKYIKETENTSPKS